MYALRGDVDSLFESMRVLATQELNPAIIPPDVLKTILHRIENDIRSNARLKLCEDNKTDTYSITGLLDAYFDCTFNGSILAYEPL